MPHYREIAPAGPAGDLLECAWTASRPDRHVQRVLPDGCMDLIVLDGDLVVAGPDTAAHLATSEAGTVTTGLRFRPGALPDLLGVPAERLRDLRVDLADVLTPDLRRAVARAVGPTGRGTATGATDGQAGLRLLTGTAVALRGAAAGRARPLPEPLPAPALRALVRGTPVGELAAELGVSTRTLHRQCRATLGYGPAVARRVLRFRAASRLLSAGVRPAEVAARTGYADQPHLSREVGALAGLSPSALRPAAPGRPG